MWTMRNTLAGQMGNAWYKCTAGEEVFPSSCRRLVDRCKAHAFPWVWRACISCRCKGMLGQGVIHKVPSVTRMLPGLNPMSKRLLVCPTQKAHGFTLVLISTDSCTVSLSREWVSKFPFLHDNSYTALLPSLNVNAQAMFCDAKYIHHTTTN